MNFNKHLDLVGLHAFLSASKCHWINYDADKLILTYRNYLAIQRGTQLHEFAAQCIRFRKKLENSKNSLNQYVNDAIGFRMTPEVVLFYSPNAFGTADAISFKDGCLRIHDLKTGAGPASMNQLMVYAALFCLEYHENPMQIQIELRIYQSEEIIVLNPEGEEIMRIVEKIIESDKQIELVKLEEE